MSLKQREKELKRRISRSMQDAGSYRPTNNCKKLQRKLANVQRKRQRNRRRWHY